VVGQTQHEQQQPGADANFTQPLRAGNGDSVSANPYSSVMSVSRSARSALGIVLLPPALSDDSFAP
jgi:hypothetical protein